MPQFFTGGEIALVDLSETDRLRAKRLENSVILGHFCLQFLRKHDRLHQVGHAQPRARCFIAIRWADATFSRSNSGMPLTQLTLFIEQPVIRKDQMSAVTNEQ